MRKELFAFVIILLLLGLAVSPSIYADNKMSLDPVPDLDCDGILDLSDCEPGVFATVYHKWNRIGKFTVKCKAIDTFGLESDWAYLEITLPISQNIIYSFLEQLFDRFPNAFPILRELITL